MTAETETVVDILRPLAERTVPCPEPWMAVLVAQSQYCGRCGGTERIFDPRFEALRCKHFLTITVGDDLVCHECGMTGVRTDLGAIFDAAEACGLTEWTVCRVADGWLVRVATEDGYWGGEGLDENRTIAFARALADAV